MKPVILGLIEIDNPHSSYAQTVHEQSIGVARAGKVMAAVNLQSLLGGFAKFKGTPLQNETVKRFRNIFEASQVGGAKACDPSVEPVDGGGLRADSVYIVGADARAAYSGAKRALGAEGMKRLEYVAIGDYGPTAYARWRSGNSRPNSRVVAKFTTEMRVIVLTLAIHWKLAKTASGSSRAFKGWSDGTRAKTPSQLDDAA